MSRGWLILAKGLLFGLATVSSCQQVAAFGFPERCADDNKRISIYAFPWTGDQALARTVASILSMQIWRTLRRSDPDLPGSDFGCGLVERISPGAPHYSNIQLKGTVQRIGKDAVIQAALTFVPSNDHRPKPSEIWTIRYKDRSVAFNPLKTLYAFSPFPVRGDILKIYPSLRGIRLCARPRLPCNGGTIGVSDLDAQSQEGDFAHAKLGDGRKGWVYLPSLSDHSEVIDFVSAVMRLQRGDYRGVVDLLGPVNASIANTGIRVDAFVMQAVALELSGRSSERVTEEAAKLNPSLKSVGQIRAMRILASGAREANRDRRKRIANQARSLIVDFAKLFDPTDPWPNDALAIVDAMDQD